MTAPTSPNFTSAQWVRLMPWVQTNRWVPCSTSRATSGAPQNMPTSIGRMSSSTATRFRAPYRLVNWLNDRSQASRAPRATSAVASWRTQSGRPRSANVCRMARPSGIIRAASTANATQGEERLLAVLPPGQPDHAGTPHSV